MCPTTAGLKGLFEPCRAHMALVPGRALVAHPPQKLAPNLDLQFSRDSMGLGISACLPTGASCSEGRVLAPPFQMSPPRCAARGAWHPYTDWPRGAAAEPAEGVQGAHMSSQNRRAHDCCPRPLDAPRVINPGSLASRFASAVWWWSRCVASGEIVSPPCIHPLPHWPMSGAQVLINDACGPPGPHWDTACAPGVRGRNQTRLQAIQTEAHPRNLIRGAKGHVTPQNIPTQTPVLLTHPPSLSYTVAELPRSLFQGPGVLLHGTRHVCHSSHLSGSTA